MSRRELVLQRAHDVLKTIAPGVSYPIPGGHGPIVTNIHGRAFSKVRPQAKVKAADKPMVEFQASPRDTDRLEGADDFLSFRTLQLHVWACVGTDDGGTGHNDVSRTALNALCDDVLIAMRALPYYYSAALPTSLRAELGPVIVQHLSEWTEPAQETPWGTAVTEFSIRFPFDERFP